MTKFSMLASALLCAGSTVQAASFTPNNIVIYRIGDGVAAPTNTGAAVFLDEISIGVSGATLVQSIPMPTTATGAQRQCVASGTATSEGYISRSIDKRFLVTTCYARDLPGTGSISATTALTVPRVAARIGVNGVVDTSTALTDAADANNVRSAASVDGSAFWLVGGAGGMRYASFGATTSTQISSTVTNLRTAAIFDGQLFASASSGTFARILAIGTGLPTTTGQVAVGLPGIPITGSPYNFVQLDIDAGVAGVDTMYVADDSSAILGGGIQKWSLVGGTWVLNGTIQTAITLPATPTPISSARGLIARVNSGTSTTLSLIANGNTLISGIDSAGYNVAPAAALVVLQTAPTNTFYRGIAPTPEENTNSAPTITASTGLSRVQGSSAVSNIANVGDDAGAASVMVTVNGGASATVNGVSVSGIVNNAGAVSANIAASCAATNASFTLRATDVPGLSAESTLNISVAANTPAVLSYVSQNAVFGQNLNVNPAAGPNDNGTITSIIVQSAGTYTGANSVANTGVVSLTGVQPVGSHTLVLRATDNCAATTDANLALTVAKAASASTIVSNTPNPSIVGQPVLVRFSVVAVAPGAGTPTGMVTVSDSVDSCSAMAAVGQCSLMLTTAGNRTLSASYAGSGDFLASTATNAHVVQTPVIFTNGFEDPLP